MSATRNLATGEGERYGYSAEGLSIFVPSAGEGGRIERASDGTVGVSPVKDDLGGVARFTGETASGSLGTGGSRSEERRAGKGRVSTGRSRWSPDHYKKTITSQTH